MAGGNYEYLRIISLVTQILCIAFITLLVALRVFVVTEWKRRLDIEDGFFFLAWAFFMVYCSCGIAYGAYGGSEMESMLTQSQTMRLYKVYYVVTVIYAPMVLSVKITLLTIIARLYILQQKTNRTIIVYTVLAIVVAYYIVIIFIKIFICTPISAFWEDYANSKQHCFDESAVLVADAVMSVATDIAILLLPLALTLPMNLPRAKKFKVALMLSSGGLAIGFSIYRLGIIIREDANLDSTAVFMKILLSGNAEGGFGLICSCIPALHILFNCLRGKPSPSKPSKPSSSDQQQKQNSSDHPMQGRSPRQSQLSGAEPHISHEEDTDLEQLSIEPHTSISAPHMQLI